MLNLVETLSDQLDRSANGESWHGPSFRDALDGVTAQDAAAHPIASAHSIWEIVLHVRATCELVLRRVGGNEAALTPAEDWPPIPPVTEENWQRDVAAAFDANARLREVVRAFSPDRLDEPLVKSPSYTAFTQFIGITQHDLYHAGQIVLLKKALGR